MSIFEFEGKATRESPSDRISSKTMEETVSLKIKWILE